MPIYSQSLMQIKKLNSSFTFNDDYTIDLSPLLFNDNPSIINEDSL